MVSSWWAVCGCVTDGGAQEIAERRLHGSGGVGWAALGLGELEGLGVGHAAVVLRDGLALVVEVLAVGAWGIHTRSQVFSEVLPLGLG